MQDRGCEVGEIWRSHIVVVFYRAGALSAGLKERESREVDRGAVLVQEVVADKNFVAIVGGGATE